MIAGRKSVLQVAVVIGLCPLVAVTGFSVSVRSGVRAASASTGSAVYDLPSDTSLGSRRHASATTMAATGATPGTTAAMKAPNFGEMLGDKVASAIVGSPIYPLLIRQAKDTMKKSAQVMLCILQLVFYEHV